MQMKPISYLPATQPPYGKGVIHPSNSNGRKLGFVAQDMMEILPEVVAHTGDSRYMIDYNSLIPLLVRTIQEQNARIVTLEQEVTALKNK